MKKYLVVAFIALGGVLVSCSNDDNEVLSTPKVNLEPQVFDYSVAQKEGDSIKISEGDTGGQGGNNPIKP
ncbi:hypothetical protein [Flavobacterium helocola]|jgi:hypothetical protein|uniref:Uncharacterized protein n=1 Tax=Flavobacterium helocola TaxID=3139139 RepID=A0ABU9I7D5_9FLAO